MPDTVVIHHQFHHPVLNLTRGKDRQNPEDDFAGRFVRSYSQRFNSIHSQLQDQKTLFVREFPVSGNGIADLVVLNWNENNHSPENGIVKPKKSDPIFRAFEFKLSNWKKGLMQAHRYTFFSNASILVIPNNKMKTVCKKIDLFRTLRVGLWGFNLSTETITRIYTPRPKKQHVPKYREKALQLIEQITA